MTEEKPKRKTRKLRRAEETVRQRAERSTAANKTKRIRLKIRIPVPGFLKKAASLRIWKPLRFIGRIIFPRYLRNSIKELRMVTWPNGKQTRQLTGAVILFSVVFGILVAIFDYGLDKLFKQVIVK